ncbi:hypothetical protein B0H16DRAFT_1735585 [Mycena metata]|uniref:Uncharacterized protein n=1 Tax=Mycena metata TaxID=1033252 RepID=A0AAD7HSX3_9AGAR|nr:hypothetical protein B0H16DRAFT_1735585 [Mycena metata]
MLAAGLARALLLRRALAQQWPSLQNPRRPAWSPLTYNLVPPVDAAVPSPSSAASCSYQRAILIGYATRFSADQLQCDVRSFPRPCPTLRRTARIYDTEFVLATQPLATPIKMLLYIDRWRWRKLVGPKPKDIEEWSYLCSASSPHRPFPHSLYPNIARAGAPAVDFMRIPVPSSPSLYSAPQRTRHHVPAAACAHPPTRRKLCVCACRYRYRANAMRMRRVPAPTYMRARNELARGGLPHIPFPSSPPSLPIPSSLPSHPFPSSPSPYPHATPLRIATRDRIRWRTFRGFENRGLEAWGRHRRWRSGNNTRNEAG